MMAVVTLRPGEWGRHYRLPTNADYAVVELRGLRNRLRECGIQVLVATEAARDAALALKPVRRPPHTFQPGRTPIGLKRYERGGDWGLAELAGISTPWGHRVGVGVREGTWGSRTGPDRVHWPHGRDGSGSRERT